MIVVSPVRANTLVANNEQNNPFFAWDNLGASATLGGSAVITGGNASNAITGTTVPKWRPVTGGTTRYLQFDFGTATNISFAAIAAHNAYTMGASVAAERSSDAVTWADGGAGVVTPSDNSPIAWRMALSGQAYRYWRFAFADVAADGLLSVGVAFMGDDLIIPRRFYQGFSPVITPTEVELQSNVSVGNELLGASVIGRGSTLSASVANVPASFIRGDDWMAFQRHFNDGGGSFFAWRPDKYPQDLYYVWRNGGVIRPSNTGPRDLMGIDFAAQVHNAQA